MAWLDLVDHVESLRLAQPRLGQAQLLRAEATGSLAMALPLRAELRRLDGLDLQRKAPACRGDGERSQTRGDPQTPDLRGTARTRYAARLAVGAVFPQE